MGLFLWPSYTKKQEIYLCFLGNDKIPKQFVPMNKKTTTDMLMQSVWLSIVYCQNRLKFFLSLGRDN